MRALRDHLGLSFAEDKGPNAACTDLSNCWIYWSVAHNAYAAADA